MTSSAQQARTDLFSSQFILLVHILINFNAFSPIRNSVIIAIIALQAYSQRGMTASCLWSSHINLSMRSKINCALTRLSENHGSISLACSVQTNEL